MKKTAFLLAVVLILCLLPVGSAAYNNTQLIVIGDTIKMLQAPDQIITIGDEVLLPADIVASALGVNLTVDRKERTITLIKGKVFITYLTDQDVVYVTDKRPVDAKSIINGSNVYISAGIAAEEFNYIFTSLSIPSISNSIPRIKSKKWKITDSTMISIINAMPFISEPKVSNPSHYLCFIGISSYFSQQLQTLSKNGVKSIFFLTYSDIQNNLPAVLSIIAGGHTIGLIPEPSFENGGRKTSSQIVAEFNRCNNLLFKLTRTNTSVVMFQKGSVYNTETIKSSLSKAGYRLWKTSYEYPLSDLADSNTSSILKAAGNVLPHLQWNSLIYVKNLSNAVDSLGDLIAIMKSDAFRIKKPSDTSTPVNFYTINDY